jgi:hypothetical protein
MFEPWLTRWSLISEGDPIFTASSRSSRLLKWIIAYTGLSAAWLIEDGASPARWPRRRLPHDAPQVTRLSPSAKSGPCKSLIPLISSPP